MKNQKNRSMKVYSQNGRNYKATPTIILKGQWLEEMGFAIGDYISVSCENGKLVIKVLTEEVTGSFQGQIKIFKNRIPSTVKVGESIYYSMPIALYSKKASAGIAYRKFAKELIDYEG